ncbi:hypothetical protein GCM10023195_71960 [Actinoallomurus liliacearum]|uniref:Uncharacterized protein n=1 Tax=Actinoallomurus liliacearum TaxID=1080073 RepID=A0ABP8TW10_9ACTN
MTAVPTRHRARRPLWTQHACPRCAGDVLAVLRLPHGWRTEQGTEVTGFTEIVLCARCDLDDPITGPIVTFFAVHEIATDRTVDVLARLIRRWIENARPARLDQAALDAEIDAWYRGDL